MKNTTIIHIIICLCLACVTGCSLDELPDYTICPSRADLKMFDITSGTSTSHLKGVIHDNIYGYTEQVPEGYITDWDNDVCPYSDQQDAKRYDYCIPTRIAPETGAISGFVCSFCPEHQILCQNHCTDVTTNENCGACGHKCNTGETCQIGKCKPMS